ncbi:hypothetical protein [Carboxylicivirga sp. N1Y90]|uniref:hypothetical protein n=1 Tax=Carboxylicivirga fragile TaxID=3417571 RepID=UPI003D34D5C9|nr:hypothetical protein [Marinilabiliaceae bacterium N1Y90]
MSLKNNFGFSIAELLQRGDKFIFCFDRDKAEFEGYGYGDDIRSTIISSIAALKALPTDIYYEGEQKMCTNNKNEIREDLEHDINDLANRSRLALGAKSVEYSLFRFGTLAELSDNDMVSKASHVVQVAQKRMDKLAKRMVNDELLNAITTGGNKLDDAIDKQAEAQSIRKEKVVERHNMANDLYKNMSELCEAGKRIWKGKNEAYYTDYVIYGSSKPMADQAEEDNEE